MNLPGGRLRSVAPDARATDVEQLLELYGRSVTPEPAADLARRVMDAVALAVPGAVATPAHRLGRRTPMVMANLLTRPRRLTIRVALVAILTVALSAVALASDSHRNAAPTAPFAEDGGVLPDPSPTVLPGSHTVNAAETPGSEDPGEDGESDSADPGDDAESDDADDGRDRPEEEEGDGDAPDDEADEDAPDSEVDDERAGSTEEEEHASFDSDEPEADAPDEPDDESDG